MASDADRRLRTVDELTAHRRIEAAAAEVRLVHRWARRHEPALAARLSLSLTLHAYTRMWGEPGTWARALLAVLPDTDPAVPATAAALAASSPDHRVRLTGLEILADVVLYRGALDDARRHASVSRRLAEQTGDRHAWSMAVVGQAVALAFQGDRSGAMRTLDELGDLDGLAPSNRAWQAFAFGEITAGDDPELTLDAFAEAIELGRLVDNRFVTAVAEISQTSLLARSGDADGARRALRANLGECRRRGNLAHGATLLRNLVELLTRLEDDELAVTLLGALSAPGVKGTYGDEARRLDEAARRIEVRRGVTLVERWRSKGRRHGLTWALDRALDY